MEGFVQSVSEIWFCYMVRCKDDSLYVGIATDPLKRLKRHNWGLGPEFTARRRPVELIWSERCGSSAAARQREREIKGWNREKKLALVARLRAEISEAAAREFER